MASASVLAEAAMQVQLPRAQVRPGDPAGGLPAGPAAAPRQRDADGDGQAAVREQHARRPRPPRRRRAEQVPGAAHEVRGGHGGVLALRLRRRRRGEGGAAGVQGDPLPDARHAPPEHVRLRLDLLRKNPIAGVVSCLTRWRRRHRVRLCVCRSVSPEEQRSLGRCPLTPEEAGLVLTALGYDRGTFIYVAGSQIYGGAARLRPLTRLFPNLVTKEDVLSSAELAPFKNFSSRVGKTSNTSPASNAISSVILTSERKKKQNAARGAGLHRVRLGGRVRSDGLRQPAVVAGVRVPGVPRQGEGADAAPEPEAIRADPGRGGGDRVGRIREEGEEHGGGVQAGQRAAAGAERVPAAEDARVHVQGSRRRQRRLLMTAPPAGEFSASRSKFFCA